MLPVRIFSLARSQWVFARGVRPRLPYSEVETILRIERVPRPEWSKLLADIRVLEFETVKCWQQ